MKTVINIIFSIFLMINLAHSEANLSNDSIRVNINRQSNYFAFCRPIKIKINDKKYKIRSNHSYYLMINKNESILIKSNHLFSKKDFLFQTNQNVINIDAHFKLNLLYLNPTFLETTDLKKTKKGNIKL